MIKRDFPPNQLPLVIEAVFACEDAGETVRRLPRDDTQTFVDVIDEARRTFAHYCGFIQ